MTGSATYHRRRFAAALVAAQRALQRCELTAAGSAKLPLQLRLWDIAAARSHIARATRHLRSYRSAGTPVS